MPARTKQPISPELLELGYDYETAARAYTLDVCRTGGGVVHVEPDFTLTVLPHAHSVSGIISPHFADTQLDTRLDLALALARRCGEDIRFKLGPSTQPADLARHLEARDLKRSASMKYYGMNLNGGLPRFRPPDGLRIFLVEDFDALLFQPHPFYGNKASPRKRALLAAFSRLAHETPRRLFVFTAELHHQFAAMAVIYIHGEVVVGYDFVVLQALRRQGIGAAMLLQMGDFSIQQGARRAALLSSTQGLKFYPHFGFQPVGVFPTFSYTRAMQQKDSARCDTNEPFIH